MPRGTWETRSLRSPAVFYLPIPRPPPRHYSSRSPKSNFLDNSLKIPLSPWNGNLPFPYPPIPQGSFPVREKASLVVTLKNLFQFFQGRYMIFVLIYKYGIKHCFKFQPWIFFRLDAALVTKQPMFSKLKIWLKINWGPIIIFMKVKTYSLFSEDGLLSFLRHFLLNTPSIQSIYE